jgi:hypothetical protein
VETITTKLMRRRLEWLGHLARMSFSQGQPLQQAVEETPTWRSRWRDLVKIDLKALGFSTDCWYEAWRGVWGQKLEEYQRQQQQPRGVMGERDLIYSECGRPFKRKACGAVQCKNFERWFRSRDSLAV